MKTGMLILAALVLTPIAAIAQSDSHRGMMPGMMHGTHGMAEAGQEGNGGHAGEAGRPGDLNRVSRAIQVVMGDDMKFTPAQINVRRGETIEFVVRNAGQTKHEMVIGSMTELKEHAELMRKMPGMEHDDPTRVALDPGKSGELVWQFTKAGTVDFACLQPGHFEAGMLGTVSVK